MKPFIGEFDAKVIPSSSTRVRGSAAVASASLARVSAPACEMPVRSCAAAAVLLEGGPVRVPFRACCAAALLRGLRGTSGEISGRPG